MKKSKEVCSELWKNRALYLMMVPTILWVAVFCYVPMYGVLIAFKDFSYKKGILGSPSVGLKNFEFLFRYKGVGRIFFNTIFLNILFITATTLLSIFFAIVFSEIAGRLYSRVVQTIAIFPHFVSWTVVAMFMVKSLVWVNALMVRSSLLSWLTALTLMLRRSSRKVLVRPTVPMLMPVFQPCRL